MILTRLFAPMPKPELNGTVSTGIIPLPSSIPELAARYLSPDGRPEIQEVRTAAYWGRWRFQAGLIGIPSSHVVFYRFGESMQRRMRLYLFRIPLVRGLDTLDLLANDARTMIAGKVLDSGTRVVPSAAVVLWLDAFIFRSTAILEPQVEWDQTGERSLRMSYPVQGERDSVDIHFSEGGRRVIGASTMRRKASTDPEKTLWQVTVHGWREFSGLEYPSEFSVRWEGDKRPWSRWLIERLALNVEP